MKKDQKITVLDLYVNRMHLSAQCPLCGHSTPVDLTGQVNAGRGSTLVRSLVLECAHCLRPAVPHIKRPGALTLLTSSTSSD
jgi:hypothetical protein